MPSRNMKLKWDELCSESTETRRYFESPKDPLVAVPNNGSNLKLHFSHFFRNQILCLDHCTVQQVITYVEVYIWLTPYKYGGLLTSRTPCTDLMGESRICYHLKNLLPFGYIIESNFQFLKCDPRPSDKCEVFTGEICVETDQMAQMVDVKKCFLYSNV